ncbi:selenium-dependent molybdenum cofactor biosynthesis protein YqeB [Sphaerochaeta globosa]|uniref:Selenium-dependent molybdenum hydroxylase system protein, YqeB family n=1 Tax=Sphaerochaeta globosa (strain ATCC BAA-1886 / DSM 22777 / Buddy) TaxID=158189 RepID=F0RZE6_SPHGB|nr:selenium-dependent molybdenum cofactor biosynthesis protein YqeB [Sphaerochaeta globosa]ADY13498.1 selenium-dependent molybdenum hydroxylase system protein, YqeB family [Sphaerochaeta globosa str. Buddy]
MNTIVVQQAVTLIGEAKKFVYISILKTEGSASRSQGSMVVDEEGTITGTIGGGETEAYAQRQALVLLQNGEPYRYLKYQVAQAEIADAGTVHLLLLASTNEAVQTAFLQFGVWQEHQMHHVMGLQILPSLSLLGLSEGGATIGDVHAEFLTQAKQALAEDRARYIQNSNWMCHLSVPVQAHGLLLIGGGHVNQAIANLAHFVGLSTQVVETRSEFATADLFPHAKRRVVAPTLEMALGDVDCNHHTACIIASHAFDQQAAKLLLEKDIAYLGVLGSRHKAKKLVTSFHLDSEALEKLYCPIGLDLASETPQEIAVSVIAEVMKVFHNASGGSMKNLGKKVVLVRGGGDLATGVILRLHRSGYRVIVLETEQPTVIRTTVSLAQAMYSGTVIVEGVQAQRCSSVKEAFNVLDEKRIPILCDPDMQCIAEVNPVCVVDAIIAKRNLGTRIDDAPFVIALGPGFEAGVDADVVIETKRGHSLGRIIRKGCAIANTGIPGLVDGFGKERVLHSPKSGVFKAACKVGDIVSKGSIIAWVDGEPIVAPIDGKLRGLLNSGLTVSEHFKVADIDPRGEEADHTTVSEKAYAIAGAVLEALDAFLNRA